MLIGELSEKTGLSRHTIRFYEKIKLINVNPNNRRGNNYKEYDDELVEQLTFINRYKSLGFSLGEVAEFVNLEKIDKLSCESESVSRLYQLKLVDIDRKIKDLKSIKRKLIKTGQNCYGDCKEALETVTV